MARHAASSRIGEGYLQDHFSEATAFGPEPNSDKGRPTIISILAQVPPTSRRLSPRYAAMVRVAVVLAAVALLAGCGHASAPTDGAVVSAGPLPAGVFVASYAYGSGDLGGGHGTFLSLFDEQSGRHLRDLVHLDEGSAVGLAGSSRAADGSIVYALARGPHYQSGVANGDPEAGSCGGTVYKLSAATGQATSLFTVGRDSTVGDPTVSPDGRSVAYLSHPCTAAFDEQVVVRDLATGRARRVWVPTASASQVAWRSDGAKLVITVRFSQQRSDTDASGYVVVPADADGPQPRTTVQHAPDRGCVVTTAVFATGGIQLVEGCPNGTTAPARLVQLVDSGPRVAWRASTGLCPNGLTLASDPHGQLLTSTSKCGGAGAPVDVVQAWTGQHVREIGRYVNPAQFVADAT